MSRSPRFLPVEVRRFLAGAAPAGDTTGDGVELPASFVTYRWGWAPAGLLTRRQLTTLGLRPAGQHPCAEIVWRESSPRGPRVAYLYRLDAAKPKRPATPAQLAALERAVRARRTCPACGRVAAYCLPRRTGRCLDCEDPWAARPAA